ncbi:Membrane-associated guanylate kinase, WW and PDZ domain-containing protein 2 [Amphibalanus amphitrite]|uniref:Membrane-associated guanylate kinase, WW and PDZ domain-containing protein 2 n=1 Tax=Amphibalanus amphitrite TaxID=1232801 RepID=A0A6A4VJ37_AMPAM|nr:Membrane-associated guanylate kinase, WW and PDZ domain-containing protein 2 [Amphibalanus amphitrite]
MLSGGARRGEPAHWSVDLRETVLTADPERLYIEIDGGSEEGQFGCVGAVQHERVNYISGRLEPGEVLVEVQGQKVGGYTRRDITTWLKHCCRSGTPVVIRTARLGPAFSSPTRDPTLPGPPCS